MREIFVKISDDGRIWYNGDRYSKDPSYLVCPVKHHKRGRAFLFSPTSFIPLIGDVVLCETQRGIAKGVVVGDVYFTQCDGQPKNIIELVSHSK